MKNWKIITIVGIAAVLAAALLTTSVFAMGMMTSGFLSHMATDWVGDGRLRKYKIRFTRQVWPGDTVNCKGKVTKKYTEGGKNYIAADIFSENQRGEKVITASIVAELPKKTS